MRVIGDLGQSSSAGGPRGREERASEATRAALARRSAAEGSRETGGSWTAAGDRQGLEAVAGGPWRGFHQLGVTDEDTEAREAEQLPLWPRFEPAHPGAAVLGPSGHALVGAIYTGSCMARWVHGALVLSV